ncbi:MFS transporter [Actinospica durhamensis]|uniref:MFS transporter n=1 Tax=Actinospica durhamensis TaxID=1508375 RepID=A0A941EKI4_9ACTN|nr:MFS transporter [Actinospica durhamensis]MBR7833026.1 MFS transporter [Actinospica durhamensis]
MTRNQVVEGAAPRAGRREWIALAVLLLPLLLVSMDTSVLLYAVPFITRALHPSSTQQLWMYDMYGFVLAGLLITMGAIGDRIGRRRLLLVGAFFFSVASLGAAYAGSAGELIAARAVQGVAGATLMPSTLALIRNLFHDEAQRRKAIGVWTGGMMGGILIGPVISGILLDHYFWGSVFLINLPFMVLLLVLGPILLPEYRTDRSGRFDLLGALLSFAAVLPIIFGVSEIAENGLDPLRLGSIACGLIVGALFLIRQRTAQHPMLELRLFRSRGYSGALLTNLVGTFALLGNAIFLTQYLQSVLGMSPLKAALWSVVPSLGVGAMIGLCSALVKVVERAYIVAGCFTVMISGYVVQAALLRADSPLWVSMLGAALLACGAVGVMTLGNELLMSAIPPERAGSAAAVNETVGELGGALGMAVLGSIGAAVYRHHLGTAVPTGARSTLGGAVATAVHLPVSEAEHLLSLARTAFTAGLNTVSLVGAALMAVAALLTALFLRGVTPADPAAPAAEDSVSATADTDTDTTVPSPDDAITARAADATASTGAASTAAASTATASTATPVAQPYSSAEALI